MARKKSEIGGGTAVEETTQPVEPETTSEETLEPGAEEGDTITLSQKDLRDRENAARGEIGRTLKTTLEAHSVLQRNYDAQGRQLTELGETVRSLKQRERERELKSAEGTPDLIDSVRLKHQAEDEWDKVNKARSDFERERTEHQVAVDKALRIEAEEKARQLAKESGLTAELLLQIGSDTADNGRVTYNLKRMESIAKTVPKGEEEEESEKETETSEVKGQRARAAGAGSRSATRGFRTWEDYEKAFISGEISFEQYQEAAKRFNVTL